MSSVTDFKLLKDFFALSGGQLLSKIIGFLAFAYLARTLDPAEYGAVEYAVGLAVFFAMLVDCGLGPIGVRALSRGPDRITEMAALIPTARLLLAALAIPVMGFSAWLTGQTAETTTLIWLFAAGLLAVPWKQDWLFQGLEKMGVTAMAQVIRMTVFAGGVFVFVHGTHDLLHIGYIEMTAAFMMAVYYLGAQRFSAIPIRLHFLWGKLAHLVREGVSVGLSNMVWAVIQYVPLFLVAGMVGGAETAWFGASHRVVISLLTFSWIYHFNLYPALTRRAGDVPQALSVLVRASFRVVAWVSILAALVLTLLASPLLVLAFGAQFAQAAPAFQILVWVLPATILAGHARWALIATGYQRYVLYAQTAGAVTVIVMGTALVPVFHSVGAAIAMLAASLAVWLVAHFYAAAQVERLPALSLVWLPSLLAGSGVLAAVFLENALWGGPWMMTALTVAIYALCAPLLDRDLMADLRHLIGAKADL